MWPCSLHRPQIYVSNLDFRTYGLLPHTAGEKGLCDEKTMTESWLLANDRLCWEKGKWHETNSPSVSTSQNTFLRTRPSAGLARGPPSCQKAAQGRL